MDTQVSLEKGLKDPVWKARRQTYQRLIYFLQQGNMDIPFGGQILTNDKIAALLNSLIEQQNNFVALQGMQCVKLISSQPIFKISNMNHFLSEGLQKFSVSDRLQTEFEDILNSLMEKWTAFLISILISKFENKNPKVIIFCLKILTGNIKKILKNKQASSTLYKAIQHLYSSQNKTIRLSAVQISTSLQQVLGKKQIKQSRSNLSEIYNQLLKSFDQMDTPKRIDVAGQLRRAIQQLDITIEPDQDHFTLIYCLRMMVEDNNQLLWSEGVRVLTLLVERGLKLKEIGYLVDKLRVGKYAPNQIVFQLFDLIVVNAAKKTEEYVSSILELFDNSNRENIKVGVLHLVLRLVYLVNKLSENEQTCERIQIRVFKSMVLYEDCLPSSNSTVKNRLISCYNKQVLKWLVGVHASARYKELTEEIVLAMKPFQERNAITDKSLPTEKQNKKPLQQDLKAQGLDKVLQDVILSHNSVKDLDRKMQKVAEFLAQKAQRYEDSFYFIDLVTKLSVNLSHIKLSPQCAQKLSGFVVFLLKHFIKTYPDPDSDSCQQFLGITLKRLSFSKDESRLRDILSEFAGRQKLLSKIFLKISRVSFQPKISTLKLISKWLIDNAKSFSRCDDYYEILDIISSKIDALEEQKTKKISAKLPQIKVEQYVSRVSQVPIQIPNKHSEDQKILSVDSQQQIKHISSSRGKGIQSIESDDREPEQYIQINQAHNAQNSVEDTLNLDDIHIGHHQQSNFEQAPSYQFEHLEGIPGNGLPVQQMKSRLATPKNCFFFLKNQVYKKIKNAFQIEDKQHILSQLLDVVSTANISDICYQNLLNALFMLFVQVRKHPSLALELQNIYEVLRQRKTPGQFMVSLLKSAKPIFQSVSQPEDCEFVATILSRSLERLAQHVEKDEYLTLLCDINDFFQLGQVVYFELYKSQYSLVINSLFKSAKQWLSHLNQTDRAAILDTFQSLFDSSFKRFVEQQLTSH